MINRKSKQLDHSDLIKWMGNFRVLYASDNGRKKLYLTSRGDFEIEVMGEIVWRGIQSFSAVEEYNRH